MIKPIKTVVVMTLKVYILFDLNQKAIKKCGINQSRFAPKGAEREEQGKEDTKDLKIMS